MHLAQKHQSRAILLDPIAWLTLYYVSSLATIKVVAIVSGRPYMAANLTAIFNLANS